MKLIPKSKINLQRLPVKKWLKNFDLKYDAKTGGQTTGIEIGIIRDDKILLKDRKIDMLSPSEFMQCFRNVENSFDVKMFV